MLGLFHKPWAFDSVGFNAWLVEYDKDIERRMKVAQDFYWEIQGWLTPVESWKKLQIVPVPLKPVAARQTYAAVFNGSLQVNSASVPGMYRPNDGLTYHFKPSDRIILLKLLPGEPYEVGSVIKRPEGRYKVVERLFDNTNRVKVRSLSWLRL